MCYGCWEEQGAPVSENLEIGRSSYAAQRLDPFGALHIVIDDWNVDDDCLVFCMNHPELTAPESRFITHFRTLTTDERVAALALADGYWGVSSIHDKPKVA